MNFTVRGIIAAMVTPFDSTGEQLNLEGAQALLEKLIAEGVNGVFVGGTTGEGLLLSVEERKTLLEAVVGFAQGRVKVIAHSGCIDTRTTIELTRHAAEAGADAAGVVAPPFYNLGDDALAAHFRAAAEAAPGFPILLYNIPSHSKNRISPGTALALMESVGNIVGIKDSTGDMGGFNELAAAAPDGACLINGVDEYGLQALVAGAPAVISGTANVALPIYRRLVDAFNQGDMETARAEQVNMTRFCQAISSGYALPLIKEGVRLKGIDAGPVRAPFLPVAPEASQKLREAMEALALLP